MKTLDEIKNEVAMEKGFKSWYPDLHEDFICNKVGYVYLNKIHNEVAKRYASQALDEAAGQSKEMIYDINGDNPVAGVGLVLRNFQSCYATPKQSILKLKDKL